MSRRARSAVLTSAVMVFSALFLAGCAAQMPGTAAPAAAAPAPPAPAAPSADGESVAALQTAAQAYFAAVNANDQAAATAMTCFRQGPGLLFEVAARDADAEWRIVNPQIVEPRQGLVGIGIVGGPEAGRPLPFTFDGQRWCVDA